MTYPVIDVSQWVLARDEQMGSKSKGWLISPQNERWLFKQPRVHNGVDSGEDWRKKIACEFATLVGIPCPRVELTVYEGNRGSITRSFLTDRYKQQLVHGNELLVRRDPTYPAVDETAFTTASHTVSRVLEVLGDGSIDPPNAPLPPGVQTAVGAFIGYLLFDAWIGNTVRARLRRDRVGDDPALKKEIRRCCKRLQSSPSPLNCPGRRCAARMVDWNLPRKPRKRSPGRMLHAPQDDHD